MLSLAWPIQTAMLTPSNQNVPPEVLPLGHERQGEQSLQVHALHQQPEIICQDAELEESHGWFTGCLQGTHHRAWFCLDMSRWKHIFSFITWCLCMQNKYKTRKYIVPMHKWKFPSTQPHLCYSFCNDTLSDALVAPRCKKKKQWLMHLQSLVGSRKSHKCLSFKDRTDNSNTGVKVIPLPVPVRPLIPEPLY